MKPATHFGAATGDDTLVGGDGDDTFIYQLGNGNDIIQGAGEGDLVQLSGIALSDLTASFSGRDAQFVFSDGGTLTVKNATTAGVEVEVENVRYAYDSDSKSWKAQ